jgi:pimeloyl-ACP methyl ester carboxylesterase
MQAVKVLSANVGWQQPRKIYSSVTDSDATMTGSMTGSEHAVRPFGAQRWTLALATLALFAACARESPETEEVPAVPETVSSSDGVPISYEVQGTGPVALVFIHGWSCDRSYWEAQLEPFSRDFQVVAVDLAGHGGSGLGREAWTIESFGGDAAAVVGELGLERVILIGHSMGGDVIMEAARLLPGRVEGLVWVDTYRQLGTPRTAEQVQAMMAPFRADFEETTRTFVRGMFPPGAEESLVERVAADMSAAPPAVALGALEAAIAYDREVTVALQELNLPAVAINPDNLPTDIESMERYGVDVVLMPGVGHFLMMEDPEGFHPLLREVIEEFLL